MPNLAANLLDSARRHPGRTALRLGAEAVTYQELDERSARVAALLRRLGTKPGDPVALMLPNVLEFVVLYYGILRAGRVVVPMNPLLKAREAAFYLKDSGAALIFVRGDGPGDGAEGAAAAGAAVVAAEPDALAALLAEHAPHQAIEPVADDDTAVILYTSGTTGHPKGAALTHGNLSHNTAVYAGGVQGLQSDDVILGCLPLFHTFGQTCAMNSAVYKGSELTLLPRFDPQAAFDAIERDRVTVFAGVPTMYSALLHHPAAKDADVSSLRQCVSGGASLPVELLHEFERAFGCVILEGYGLSETSPVVTFNHADRPRKPGSIGTPIRDVEVKLVDEDSGIGEIAVRGPNVMKGYWNRPLETRLAIPDGWLRTGDLAWQDDDGYLFIVDRKKDLVIRGGYNVYPREIEEVLHEHPDVELAAVLGVPDDHLGEEVAAAVVLRAGAATTADELRAFVKERVAAYKYPRHVWLLDALPTGPSGKILKRAIEPPAKEPSVFTFTSSDGLTVHVHEWAAAEPRGVVQIAHGMGEHALRYAPLAHALAARGYAVYAADHRGHGATMLPGQPGVLGADGWNLLVEDVAALTRILREHHPGVPVVLLGHSLGSFAAQQYMLDHSALVDAVALSGTTAVDELFGVLAAAGGDVMAAFNAGFQPARTEADWLSRDEAQVDLYVADPLCGFTLDELSMGGLAGAATARLAEPAGIPADLPLYVLVGDRDPLNQHLALSDLAVERYRKAGLADITYRTYPDARHELFNETNRDEVVADLLVWLDRVTS
ncbi:alpha/beta fold hydrolase [Actinokineospora sp. HUAS TT18]|uniref:alpha/beta fold hydrolase n=1 Tax=Actinokineospora sp. HUAS TT18 TaxID=3447451 RepID=UPI003F51EE13